MRIAALDLGSNSFHLLVTDAAADGTLTPVAREKVMLRLGDVVAREGRLPPDTLETTLQTLKRFAAIIAVSDVDETVVCATSAIRDAANRDEIIARAATEAGLDIRVIDGLEEAALIFEAVRASLVLDPPPALCLDLGGGSLELTVGDVAGARFSTSVPLGVARLTAQLVASDPPTKGELKRVRNRVYEVLDPLGDTIDELDPRMLVGTSGTLCDLAAMAFHRRTGALPTSLNQLTVGYDEIRALHRDLSRATAEERRSMPGLEPRRAEVMPAGSRLLLATMQLFDFESLTVGEWALREGMALDAVRRAGGGVEHLDPHAIREASVLDLARRCGWPEPHSRTVASLAESLFDQTRQLHRLDGEGRDLLRYGALLHDIGEHVSVENHAQHTAYLIEHGRLRGFDPGEVAMLACLGRYHRRGEPKSGSEAYARLRPQRRLLVDMLVPLLQVAHSLDHARTNAVSEISVTLDDETVRVAAVATTDADLELWAAERTRKRFERVFGRTLQFTRAGDAASARVN